MAHQNWNYEVHQANSRYTTVKTRAARSYHFDTGNYHSLVYIPHKIKLFREADQELQPNNVEIHQVTPVTKLPPFIRLRPHPCVKQMYNDRWSPSLHCKSLYYLALQSLVRC